MHDAEGLVQVLQPQHHLCQVDARERLLEAADALEQGVEVAAREVLHDEVEVVLALEAEEELDDVGVVRLHEDVPLRHDALRVVDLDEALVFALHLCRGRSDGDRRGDGRSDGGGGDARSVRARVEVGARARVKVGVRARVEVRARARVEWGSSSGRAP